ncbi:hypothetical protein AAW02_22595 [Aeromonas dhakensis]|uniref:hypothetical protein n=1 Tax=Aeromonas dhakensis TaxID=196024 RepID=UPI000C0BD8B6|nr:hypothetical protein [Aeromonas dhakensis]PHS82368.1 hypothetical protein AAW03_22745 [Aeromonas dhakensis]PHS82479.1 hypothetical protein AAW02_22595 [Aeromonas dhakensis]
MAVQEEVKQGIYYVRGDASRSMSEAQAAGDLIPIVKGLAIDEWGLEQVVFIMKENVAALAMDHLTNGYICWYDGHRQWSLEEMQTRLTGKLKP